MGQPFVTLHPLNVLVRMGFSDVCEAIKRRNTANNIPAALRMKVLPEQKYDQDVLRYRLEMDKPSEADDSESPTDVDTDTETRCQHLGMIWTGHYTLQLNCPPYNPGLGWAAGKGPGEKLHADIFLCTPAFSNRYQLQLRSFQLRFNFDRHNRAFFTARITSSSLPELTVNGVGVGREMHVLNQNRMNVQVGQLQYYIQFTDYALTERYMEQRARYVTSTLKGPEDVVFDMRSPSSGVRTFGQWTLGGPLGKGSAGKVYLGTNSKNQVVAVKIVEVNPKSREMVRKEIAAYRDLTALAAKYNEGGRIVRLKETIDPRDEASCSSSVFDDVGLVLKPVAPKTLGDLVGKSSFNGGHKGMSNEAASVFRDALLGLKFMHDHDWVHCDIKPPNIGVTSGGAVLLDLGQAKHLKPGCMLPAMPGCGGTIGYLAPEREMTQYDRSVDIWAMACIGVELTYGYQLLSFQVNPRRPGKEYEEMRGMFHKKYQKAVDRLSDDYGKYDGRPADRDPNFIHLGDLLIQMLRHPFQSGAHVARINVDEVLNHPV